MKLIPFCVLCLTTLGFATSAFAQNPNLHLPKTWRVGAVANYSSGFGLLAEYQYSSLHSLSLSALYIEPSEILPFGENATNGFNSPTSAVEANRIQTQQTYLAGFRRTDLLWRRFSFHIGAEIGAVFYGEPTAQYQQLVAREDFNARYAPPLRKEEVLPVVGANFGMRYHPLKCLYISASLGALRDPRIWNGEGLELHNSFAVGLNL